MWHKIKKRIDLVYIIIFIILACNNFYIALSVLIFLLILNIERDEKKKYLSGEIPFGYLVLKNKEIIFADKKICEIKKFVIGKNIDDYIYEFNIDLKEQIILLDNIFYCVYECDGKNNGGYKVFYFVRQEDNKKKYVSNIIGLIMLDNYDEALKDMEDIRKPLLSALIDRKLNACIFKLGGVIKKFEHDKYIFFIEQDKLDYFKQKRFYILDQIREIDMGNKFPITLSIGIGMQGENLNQSMEFARAALDLALGRGGDQVLIKQKDKFYFFGDKQTEIKLNTRVRARVKTYVLKELISESSNVIVMGHKNSDPDCFGSAIGIYKFVSFEGKECKIVLNNISKSIKNMYEKIIISDEYKNVFVNNEEAKKIKNEFSLVVILDTHRASLLECPDLIENFSRVVIVDHHRKNVEFINNTVMNYYETNASSTAELVTEMLNIKNINLSPTEADMLLAGIIIDTKNFVFKTSMRTYEIAAFLKKKGADTVRVKKFFRDDFDVYKIKSRAISNMEIIDKDNKKIAIAVCEKNDFAFLIAAQTADEILNINNIEAAFVLCEEKEKIIISARSLGEINVQIILERLGGGGHFTAAGVQIENIFIDEAIKKLKQVIFE